MWWLCGSVGVPADAVDVLGVLRCDWSEVAKITGRVLMVHACRERNTFKHISLKLTVSLPCGRRPSGYGGCAGSDAVMCGGGA